MKDQFVTYGIAKRLKELGFNEECFAKFDPTGIFVPRYDDSNYNTAADNYCAAPLWQQAIDWLIMRGLHCLIYPLWHNFGEELNYSYEIVHEGEQLFKESEIKTPEQARQAAIEKALTLIK